jgi:hypothetical protein
MSRLSFSVALLLAWALVGCGGSDKPGEQKAPEPQKADPEPKAKTDPEPKGKPFRSAKGGFSITFPAGATEPKEQEQGEGPAKVLVVASELPDKTSLMVTAAPQPGITKGDADESLLDAVRDGLAQSYKGKVEGEEKVKLGGYRGRSFRIPVSDTLCRVRAFVGKDRLYQVMVFGPRSTVTSKDADLFLGSFEITVK